jgi:hypothetical protein
MPLFAGAATLMVNEYRNGSGLIGTGSKMVRDEYLEFIVVERSSASDLAALRFGDSNDASALMQSVFQFDQATLEAALVGSGTSAFEAGTIIVVKGADFGAQDLTYRPFSTTVSDHAAWSIELLAGEGAKAVGGAINGNITIGNLGDVVWISSTMPAFNADYSGLTHSLGHDIAPGSLANYTINQMGAENILSATVTSGTSILNLGNEAEVLGTSTTGSIAAPNGGSNTTWIEALRGSQSISTTGTGVAPEPSRALSVGVGLLALLIRRRRRTA